MDNMTIGYIAYIDILLATIIILAAIIVYKKLHSVNTEDFEKFLKDIKDDIINCISETIDSYIDNHDISNLKLDELEIQLLDNIYDRVIIIVKDQLNQYAEASDDIIYSNMIKIIDKAITREKVISYIKILIDDNDTLQDKIMDLYNIAYKEEAVNMVKDDKELEALYEQTLIQDIDNAANEIVEDDHEVQELDPNKVVDPLKTPDPEVIIPPKEEDDNLFEDGIDDIL